MARMTKQCDTDESFRRDMERALEPGQFIPDRAAHEFVRDVEEVADRITKLSASDPRRAADLFDWFYAACQEKAGEVDDSCGGFGQFAQDLVGRWIKARQDARLDPDETACRLLRWMEDDPWGFCHGIERSIGGMFDRPGLRAFATRVRERFEEAIAPAKEGARPPANELEWRVRRWGGTLRAVYLAGKNLHEYLALAERTGISTADCHAVATLLAGRRKPEEALDWVRRGIAIARLAAHPSGMDCDLKKLERSLLLKLGRGEEALQAAWADFLERPSGYTLADLLKLVDAKNRQVLRNRALDAVAAADPEALLALFVEAGAFERLPAFIRDLPDDALEGMSHFRTEPAARKLEKGHPELAAKLWKAQGFRIVDAGKSRYYEAAIRDFERAKRCYEAAGQRNGWEALVRRMRESHKRKSGIMSSFENLVAGETPHAKPSFMDRVDSRCGRVPTARKIPR